MTFPKMLTLAHSLPWRRLLGAATLAATFFYAFVRTFAELAHHWSSDPDYSKGYLVPLFAIFLLYLRRDRCKSMRWSSSGWGIALVVFSVAIRFAADSLYIDWLDAASLLPCLMGISLILGGKKALVWSWPAIAFLGFMIPPPFPLPIALADPLQRLVILASTYALQKLGLPVLSEGNVILMNETRIGVVEACSRLSLLIPFFALATAFCLLVARPWWQKLVLVVSAVPIALIANITRITVTGVIHETVGHKGADLVFHDLAGWFMMPFAFVLLWLEVKALERLVITPVEAAFTRQGATNVPRLEVLRRTIGLGMTSPSERSVQEKEVKDALYGPPSRALLDPAWLAWNDGIVLRLARAIAEEGNYNALPILADALEEAGCTDADILGHCRSCGRDVQRSWVVNLILAAS
jgi:exosortase